MTGRPDISISREKGFTLIESVIVLGLTTLITVGIVAALLEGLDTLHTVTDTQNVEFAHQRAMNAFTEDAQSATWFWGGTVHEDEEGGSVPSATASTFYITFGWPGPGGEEVWVRYHTRTGSLAVEPETYLVRTLLTSSGTEDGSTILATGVSNLEFSYLDADDLDTVLIAEIRRIVMSLTVNAGGTTLRREYEVTMRNPNHGVKEPVGSFDELEDTLFNK